MSTWEAIQKQAALANKTLEQISEQNRIFDETLEIAKKGASVEDTPKIEKVQALMQRSIALAKQGKTDTAEALIKNFTKEWQSKS